MYKSVLKFPDGTIISSGVNTNVAVQNCAHTSSVNTGDELYLGSVNAASVQIDLITPNGTFTALPGSTFQLFKVDDAGNEHCLGVFNSERPTKVSANRYSLDAYDNIIKLDKDLSEWVNSLDAWPYSLFDFAHMVAQACGLNLINTTLINGDYLIQRFVGQGITGRKLMEWIGQICARFCRATTSGDIEFAWYTRKFKIELSPSAFTTQGVPYTIKFEDGNLSIESSNMSVTDDRSGNLDITGLVVTSDDGNGNITVEVDDGARTGLPFFMNSLTYEDFVTAPIEKVQVRAVEDDVGAVWPQVADEVNTYIITGNSLLATASAQELQNVAKAIYEALEGVQYTPCEVSLFTNLGLVAGDIVKITDRNGKTIEAYIMQKTSRGQRDTLRCTGSSRRDSSSVVNNETIRTLSSKMLTIRKSIDGLNIKATQLDTKIDQSVEEITKQVAEVDVKADGISASVTALEKSTGQSVKTLTEQIAKVDVKANGISASVSSLNEKVESNKEDVSSDFDDLRKTVETYRTALELADKQIQSTVESIYATKTSQDEAITKMMSSIITQTSQSLELKFKEAQEYTDTVGGDLSSYKKEIESFIRNTSAGIEIGEVGNPYSCLLAKDRLEFRDGGSVVAYISNSKLYITHLEITGSAIIVGVEQKRRSNGNIIWRIRSGG